MLRSLSPEQRQRLRRKMAALAPWEREALRQKLVDANSDAERAALLGE
jgi:hypothetical protein